MFNEKTTNYIAKAWIRKKEAKLSTLAIYLQRAYW